MKNCDVSNSTFDAKKVQKCVLYWEKVWWGPVYEKGFIHRCLPIPPPPALTDSLSGINSRSQKKSDKLWFNIQCSISCSRRRKLIYEGIIHFLQRLPHLFFLASSFTHNMIISEIKSFEKNQRIKNIWIFWRLAHWKLFKHVTSIILHPTNWFNLNSLISKQ